MPATKSHAPQKMQRVARYLYRRGSSYTFRRNIPPYARPAFGGITEYVRSFGDVTEAKAKAQAIILGERCSRLFDEARTKGQSESKSSDIFRIKRTPDSEDIERAVRAWLVKMETSMPETPLLDRASADQHVRDLGLLDAEVVRVMRSRST